MAFLIDQMFIYILLAVIVATLIDIIIVEGRSSAVMIYMIILGAFTGWFSYMIFVFATGGLAQFDIWMILPIILTTLVSMGVLIKFADVKVMFRRPQWKVGRYTSLVATLVFVIMIGSFVVLAMYPMEFGENTVPTDTRYECTGSFVASARMKISSDLARVSIKEIASPPITIESMRSSVNFPSISENPGEGQYLNFQVTFTVKSGSSTWEKPYCKIWIFGDSNNNGKPDFGEPFVNSLHYKFPTSNSVHFRNNIAWEGDVALYQINVLTINGVDTPLPCFYGDISRWKQDEGQTVRNTPEKYYVPTDMMSWETFRGELVRAKEQVTGYTTRGPGQEIVVDGKMYCPPGFAGHYGIVYQAFDARYTHPFKVDETPLAQKIDLFEIGGDGNGNGGYPGVDITTSSWVTGAVLGGLTILASVVAVIKGPKLLLGK